MKILFLLLCVRGAISAPKLVILLVDGVRWDYLNDPNLKSFHSIAKNGVRAPYLLPVYPSITYPNLYSLVTGLYPENHGFVGNHLFSQDTGTFFQNISNPDSTEPIWWNEAEPIWITAEKNQLSTALYWWGGCEVRIRGRHPTICERERYGPPTPEERADFSERIDDIVQMFKPSKRLQRLSLALIYYGSTDYVGHKYGPNSKEVKEALYEIDGLIGRLLRKLDEAGLKDQVNIMIASDHGMTFNSNIKYIDLDKFAADIQFQVSAGTESMIVPRNGMLDKLYNDLKEANLKGVEIYKKENIPSRYHVKESKRMTPLYLVAEKGFTIKWLNSTQPSGNKGYHGYDSSQMEDMRGIFLAHGPDFRSSFKTEALHMTDLYNAMCKVLHVDPLPNNGSWERVAPMMHSLSSDLPRSSAAHPSVISILMALILSKIACQKCLFSF